ncbi:MAG: MFS transporter [Clostridiales bacterium]|nr:MFS transporter [Clostridiales bacterium]
MILKEKYYRRNYLTLMAEGFLFMFAITLFSQTTVLPTYISLISNKAIYLGLISIIYYGLSYPAGILSCVIGVNAKSTKRTSILIMFLQRVGFFLIYLSTYALSYNPNIALTLFFISYAITAISLGMSNPMFSQLISVSIHRDVGKFFGSYMLMGAISGVLAARFLNYSLGKFSFPQNYRNSFLAGLLFALTATAVVSFGLKEVKEEGNSKKLKYSELFPLMKEILKENKKFKEFLIIRIIISASEFSIPYYIVKVGSMPDASINTVGTMTTIMLLSAIISSKIMGFICDKLGPNNTLKISCVFGIALTIIAVFMRTYVMGMIIFSLIGFVEKGIAISSNVACITFSTGKNTVIYSALYSLLCTPFLIIIPILVGINMKDGVNNTVFIFALIVYVVTIIVSIIRKSYLSR